MNLIEIFRAEAGSDLRRALAIAILAAVANTTLLAGLIDAAQAPESVGFRHLTLALLLLLLYTLASRHVSRWSLTVFEAALHRIKVRVASKLVRAELDTLEQVKAAEICDRVTENMTFISDRASVIPASVQSTLLLAFIAIYIVWLCPIALTLIVLLVMIAGGLFLSVRREFVGAVQQTNRLRVRFFARIADLLDGYKQLKFSRRAADDLHRDIVIESEALRNAGIRSSVLLADNTMMTNGLVYALLGAIAFILQEYIELGPGVLSSLVAVAIFIRGPIATLSLGLLPYIRANLALAEIGRLEAKLAQATNTQPLVYEPEDPWPGPFASIVTTELGYRYRRKPGDDSSFGLGPISLEFPAGKLVFVVGGNGSGKSTLLKLLAGLYASSSGGLAADGVPVGPDNRVCYRERITAIFGDFHLFKQLHGLPEVEASEVERLLEQLGIAKAIKFIDGQFSRLELSTGQRKRLAMLVALLEDRPVMLFDEWPADQDPRFRRYFYEELLPQLRAAGKIVIAISHDDRYFDTADCVVTLDYGRVRSIEPAEARA